MSKEFIGDDVYGYTYDSVGNIVSVSKGNRTYAGSSDKETGGFSAYRSYEYDDLGQLTRENNKTTDKATNKTKVWNYDSIGNIESVLTYNYTTGNVGERQTGIDYQYTSSTGWNKLLTKLVFKEYEYNSDGSFYISSQTEKSITYDEIGNPTNYMGATLTWNGRQLTTYTKQGLGTVTYTYDSNGLRTKKTAGGVTTEYYYAGDMPVYEKRSDGTELYYFYDSYGHLSGIRNGNTSYYTATNMSGDVVAIYSGGGTCIAKYEYDAWGNVLSVKDANGDDITSQTHIAKINPIRYRGYYYDTDTELYYLQSRYYNPEIGRFLNSDNITDSNSGVLGYNTFIYCANNPVNSSDPSGHWIIKNAIKWVAKKISNGVKKIREKTSAIDGTFQSGRSISGAVFLEATVSTSVAIDAKGNIGITASYGGGIGLPTAGVSKFKTVTNAPDISYLDGESVQIGGSVDVAGVSVGGEYTTFENPTTGERYSGISVSGGGGLPLPCEAHIDITNTKVKYFNVYDEIDEVCVKIMEW